MGLISRVSSRTYRTLNSQDAFRQVQAQQQDLCHPKTTLREGTTRHRVENDRRVRPQEQERSLEGQAPFGQGPKSRPNVAHPRRQRPKEVSKVTLFSDDWYELVFSMNNT